MKIRTVIKLPRHKPAVMLMDNSLESFQKFVGGYIETVTFSADCVVICNKEWRYLGMKKNIKFLGVEFGGPVAFVGTSGEEFDSLTEDMAERIMRMVR